MTASIAPATTHLAVVAHRLLESSTDKTERGQRRAALDFDLAAQFLLPTIEAASTSELGAAAISVYMGMLALNGQLIGRDFNPGGWLGLPGKHPGMTDAEWQAATGIDPAQFPVSTHALVAVARAELERRLSVLDGLLVEDTTW